VCRPHAAQYRRVEPATTPDSGGATRSDPQLPARPDERGFVPAPEDYVRRIRLGVISSTAAAREYLAAAREHHTETDVNTLSRDWGRQADGQRQAVLGDRAGRHRERSRELLRAGLSSAQAETQAFTELAPDAATQQRLLADPVPGTPPLETPAPEPTDAVLPGSPRWRPNSQADLAPSGEVARIRANIEALRTLRAVQAADRPATPAEQALLARWSGWGAVPAALDPANERYTWVRDTLAELLDERELAAARRTVINAHYTDLGLVQAIWDGVAQLGFAGGQVLEPGCGAGNFIACAPDTAEITGIELDPTTAAIAAALHPQARILAESFAATRVTTGSFDAAVGNVPFGDVRLHDKRDNRSNHAIHNHFILKSLRAIRPGGLVAVITSAYTMDATNPAARREMQQMGDLVGAVRLPSKAHARAAGTDALTDVLVFRRREDDRSPAPFDWEYTNLVDVDGTAVRINGYFAERPQRILGSLAVGDGLYRRDEVSVAGDPAAAPAQLREALAEIAREASESGLTMSPGSSAPAAVRPAALLPNVVTRPDGYLRVNANNTFSRMDDGEWETYSPPKAQAAELRALLGLRETAVALLEAEAASLDDTPQLDRLRTALNTRYDAYTAAYGPINRFTEAPRHRRDPDTGKMVPAVDEETGEQLLRRKRPSQGGFRHDPFAPVVRALEVFNEETQTGEKADIFRQRAVAPRPPRLGADTPADALAICVDEYGEARLPTIAWLLGVDPDEARRVLGTLVYDEPASGRLETARAYLSGDVKAKLAIARNAADEDDRYAVNVTDLTAVVPPDMTAGEISDTGAVKMGAPWIGADNVQQFLREILDDPSVKVERGPGGMWTVHTAVKDTVAARSTWGTDRRTAADIAQHILEQREFVIKNTVSRRPKRQVVDLDAVMAATEKAVEMRERFADWIWEDADRAAALVAKYNDVFQRYVLRSYDDMQLSLPGLAQAFKPDPHQVAGVARIIHEPAVGLYHTVGGGKTATMIMGAMELRRLGLARKPVVVVPNQLLDQWTREFLRLYPQAKVLAASTDDLQQDRRRMMVARMATGDWDAVILTEDAFEMLPMTPEAEQAYIDRQMEELEEQISKALAAGNELTLKRLETKKANREARLEDRLDNDKDAGIWWELTGIDYIFRDESHRDKNLRTVSNVPGMSIKGSQRASQMDMKLGWLRERQPRWGTRATGTPLANSIVEMYTEYRFLRPDLMEQQGITDVDTWLATYAEGKVIIEVTPDGGGLRNKTRLDFVNLEKLVTTLHVFADVKMKNDLPDLDRPALAERADGQRLPEMVVVPPSAELLDKVAELVERAAKLKGKRPEKGDDNILKIVGEGAAAALDLRLVGLTTEETQKLDVAADRIAAYYHANKDRIYLGPDGEPHPNPGALQQVFCDMGTPNKQDPKRWTAYGALRQRLVDRGVPREKIRFIHEAEDDRARAELFASCRDGRTAVLISSTEKGGTGVNAQDRMLVLHHLDTPYRPCDLEQREGRIDRRGNQNDEIRIERYVTERSLDAFKWQKVAYKSTLAERVLTGRAGAQTEDIGDVTLSYEEMKAASTGNPLLVDHAKAKVELTRLDRLERGYRRTQTQLQWTVKSYQQSDVISRKRIAEIEAAIARRVDTRGDAFAMTVRGTPYTKRGEVNERIRNVLGLVLADPRNLDGPAVEVGQIAGFAITAKVEKMLVRIDANDVRQRRRGEREAIFVDCVRVEIDGVSSDLVLNAEDLKTADVVARLENRLVKLEAERDGEQAAIERRAAELRRAEEDLAKPFRHEHALTEARARFQQLDIELIALAAASEAEANPTAGSDDDDSDEDDEESAEPDDLAARGHAPGVGAGASAGDGRGGAPWQPSRTAAPAGAVAPPTASDQRQPAVAKTDEATLAEVLTDPVVTDAHRAWIAEQLDQLATEPRVVNAARANDYDNFRHVIDPILEDRLMDAMDVPGVTELSKHYFTFEDDETPVAFRAAFNAAASRVLYERIRATPADATPDPAVAAPAAAASGPAFTAGAARNHTHYATFDKSRYDDAYACAEHLTRDLQTQPVVTMLDPHSERGWVLTIAHPHPGTDEQLQAIQWRVMEIVEEHGGAYDWSDGTELPANDESLLDYSLAEFRQAERVDQPVGDSPDVAVSALATATEPVEAAGPAPSGPMLEQEGQGEAALPETQRTRRGHAFYPPADTAVPPLYATEGQPNGDKVIHLHYFAGGSDWWLVEYDPTIGEGFGYACRGGDADMAEWGYVNLPELEPIRAARGLVIVERDLYWTPRPAREVDLPGWRADTKPVADPTETPAPVPQAAPTLDTAKPSPVSLTGPLAPTPAAAEQDPTPEAAGSTAATADHALDQPTTEPAPAAATHHATTADGLPTTAPRAEQSPAPAPEQEPTQSPDENGGSGPDVAEALVELIDPVDQGVPLLRDAAAPSQPEAALFDGLAETRLVEKVAARVPKDAVRPDGSGQTTVLLQVVANGTYGEVSGVDGDRQPVSARGYVLKANPLSGGFGGWSRSPVMVVRLGETPNGPESALVQTGMDGRITVLQPEDGMPTGEGAPWMRMPVEEQILAARSDLGLRVEVRDGPHNELWDVEGCSERLVGEVAWWMFGGDYGSWEGQARPVFRQELVDQAIRAGRVQASAEPLPHVDAPEPDPARGGEDLAGDADARTSRPEPTVDQSTPQVEPDGPSPARQARLAKALDDFGPRYTSRNTNGYIGDGSIVRYVVDGHVKEGVTDAEHRWMQEYVDAHPKILTTKPLRPEELGARDRAASDALFDRAAQAVEDGRFDEAVRIINEAEPLYHHVDRWAEYRRWVCEAAEAADAEPSVGPELASPPAQDGLVERASAAEPPDIIAATTEVPAEAGGASTSDPIDIPPGSHPQFTPLEAAVIRDTVADHASENYGGPFRFGEDDAARYTAEGHLHDLTAQHGFGAVWDAVAAVIAADKSVLYRSQADRDRLRAEREAHAEQLARDALAAFKRTDYDEALALVGQAELIDPLYRPSRTERRPNGLTWDAIRETITSHRDNGRARSAPGSATGRPSAVQLARLDSVPGATLTPSGLTEPRAAYRIAAATLTTRRAGPRA
jgi:N12 class adenine-specific DNA methylase